MSLLCCCARNTEIEIFGQHNKGYTIRDVYEGQLYHLSNAYAIELTKHVLLCLRLLNPYIFMFY